jgi:hypothetical protein
MIRLRIAYIQEAAQNRPPGYLSTVMAAGQSDGEWLTLTEDQYRSLAAKYQPSVQSQAARVTRSIAHWVSQGFALASDKLHFTRSCVCALCPAWDSRAGRCRECGCYGVKLWLATERCPLGRW